MSRKNEREAAGGTFGGQRAHFAAAAGAEVAAAAELAVARAECKCLADRAGRKAHHEEAGLALLLRACGRRRRDGHEERPEVLFVHGDVVVAVCARADLRENGDLRCKSDRRDTDAV